MSIRTGDNGDRERLSEREIAWITIEITVVIVAWIAVTQVLADHWEVPGWVADIVSYGGGFGAAMAVAWWRIIRHGSAGPKRQARDRLLRWGARLTTDGEDAGLLVGGLAATVVGGLLLRDAGSDDSAAIWGSIFACLAAVQFARYVLRRR